MIGAQYMGNKWRLHTANDQSRATLLASGINLLGRHVHVYADNPFAIRGTNGKEIPSTKLFIDGIPISYCNDSIRKALDGIGVAQRSRVLMEYARHPETKKLTEWLTGRRFVHIDVPDRDLPSKVDMGPFTAKLYHK